MIPGVMSQYRELDSATISLIERMDVRPEPRQIERINKVIVRLKQEGLYEKFHVFNMLGAHDEQAARLNWVANEELIANNSPRFIKDVGFQYSSTGVGLNVGKNSDDLGLIYNDVSIGTYHRAPISTNTSTLGGGSGSSTTGTLAIIPRVTDTLARTYLYQPTSGSGSTWSTLTTSEGMLAGSSVAAGTRVYSNGSLVLTREPDGNRVTTPNLSDTFRYMRPYSNAQPGMTISFGYIATGLSDTEQQVLYDIVEEYLYSTLYNSLLPETKALISRMSDTPTAARAYTIDLTINSLKVQGLWDKLVFLNVFAAANSQAATLDWKSNGYDVVSYNSPEFTTDRGFTGNGSSAYLASGKNWSSVFANIMNSAAMGTWEWTNVAAHRNSLGSDNALLRLYPRGGSGELTSTLGTVWGSGSTLLTEMTTSIGLTAQHRVGNTAWHAKDGVIVNTFENVANNPVTQNVPVVYMRVENTLFGTRSLSMGFAAQDFNAEDQMNLYNVMYNYMQTIRNLR